VCSLPRTTYFTNKVKERVKPLEIHFHSDFGMGVANDQCVLAVPR
jgi:isopropylmalate/homocitrate/citramalate synthase